MGYTHYVRRRKRFGIRAYRSVLRDAARVLQVLALRGVQVRGPLGRGPPVRTKSQIAFNGDARCGHERRALGITWPAKDAHGIAAAHTKDNNQLGQPSALVRQLQAVGHALGATVSSDGSVGRDASADSDVAGQWFAGCQLRARTCGGDCSHETFALPEDFDTRGCEHEDGSYFDFCKTAFKPYDLAVQCVLIIAKHHLGDAIVVSSDGGLPLWAEARHICEQLFGYGRDFVLEE